VTLLRRLPVFVLPLLGCLAPTDGVAPRVVSVELLAPGPLVRQLDVMLERPAPLTVEYWADDVAPLRVESPAGTGHSVALTRLRAARTYRYRIAGTTHGGTFDTEALPPDLEAIQLEASGNLSVPLVLLHLYQPGGFTGYVVADETGAVVWYWRTRDFPYGMTRLINGDFVFMDSNRGLVEVTPAGTAVRELPQDLADREMHHDVIATPGNTLLFLAWDKREADGATIRGEAIWEWMLETGAVTKRWSSWDHLSLTTDRGPRSGAEWMRANSLSIGPRGNVLVSVHYFNQIISIRSDWSGIEWRLGGVNATIPVPADQQFSGQHTARELSPGRILLFDNGVDREPYSRAEELEIDASGARRVWDWRANPINFAAAVGAARRLPTGGTLVAYGMSAGLAGSTGPTEVYEVDAAGEVRWHLGVTGVRIMFRAEPLEAIGSER
jgi:hypothetical protein